MPGLVEIRIEDKQLIRKARRYPSVLAKVVRNYLDRSTRAVRGQLTDFTPVDTGLLRSSWKTKIDDTSRIPEWASILNPITYAVPLEESDSSPRGVGRIPFLAPAIEKNLRRIKRFAARMATEIEQLMKRG